jgi:hypothetical protein
MCLGNQIQRKHSSWDKEIASGHKNNLKPQSINNCNINGLRLKGRVLTNIATHFVNQCVSTPTGISTFITACNEAGWTENSYAQNGCLESPSTHIILLIQNNFCDCQDKTPLCHRNPSIKNPFDDGDCKPPVYAYDRLKLSL